ncbi:hypothetical protein BGX31_007064 [Mortierella sp. GBA43]|nr:hypothetical protein BGX31_007064 [Mortierella sp. GBA43]
MSSTPRTLVPKPSVRNKPSKSTTAPADNVYMVNSDIMIGHQESFTDHDDDGSVSSSGSSLKDVPLPPRRSHSLAEQLEMRPRGWDQSSSSPPQSPIRSYPLSSATLVSGTPASIPSSPTTATIAAELPTSRTVAAVLRQQQQQQQQQQQPQQDGRSKYRNENLLTGHVYPNSNLGPSTTTHSGPAAAVSRDSTERSSVSSVEYRPSGGRYDHLSNNGGNGNGNSHRNSRARFSAFLGHIAPSTKSNKKNKYGGSSRATAGAGTPDSQSAAGSKNNLIRDHPSYHSRNDSSMLEKQPVTTTTASSFSKGGHGHGHGSSGPRKTGTPGKDGREPETDLFNFVDIMLDMPERPTWGQVFLKLTKVLIVMSIAYFGLMALYFAAEFKQSDYMENLEVLVVDLDQAMIGINYVNFTQQLNTMPGMLTWTPQPAALYPNLSVVQDAIRNGMYWGAVVVQANASANLNKAFATPLPNYDPSKAFAFVYDGGRDPLVVKPYIVATMYTSFLQFSKMFNPAWIKFLLAYSQEKNLTITSLQVAPQVLGTPVAFEEFDVHPSTAAIIGSATTVAYIWIFLVAGGSTYLVAHVIQPMTRHASVFKTMVLLGFPLLVFLAALSMMYSLLLLTFGVPFPDGATQFMSLFGGMLLLQCAVSALVLFLIYMIPVVYIPMFTMTFVIMNIIAVFNSVELMPVFYRWVYAMPFLNAVQMARYVLMGSYNRLKYNIPVLSAWILIPVVLLPFAISRQKRIAKELEQQAEEERYQQEMRERERQQKQRLTKQRDEEEEEDVEGDERSQVRLEDLDRQEAAGDAVHESNGRQEVQEVKGYSAPRQQPTSSSRARSVRSATATGTGTGTATGSGAAAAASVSRMSRDVRRRDRGGEESDENSSSDNNSSSSEGEGFVTGDEEVLADRRRGPQTQGRLSHGPPRRGRSQSRLREGPMTSPREVK